MAYRSKPMVMPKKKAPVNKRSNKGKAPMNKRSNMQSNKGKGKGKIPKAMLERLLVHSKMHKGGMRSKHMILMLRFIKQGDSFNRHMKRLRS